LVLVAAALIAACASARSTELAPGAAAPPRPIDQSLVLVSALDAREELSAVESANGARPADSHDPVKMFLLSMAVPGSGQIVQGDKRGYLYLLAELAFWGGFYVFDKRGREDRDEYELFARNTWRYDEYLDWFAERCACDTCGSADTYECRPLAAYGTQEFYEDIGKYDTYWRWWFIDNDEYMITWPEYSSGDLNLRDRYWDMRRESDRNLRSGRYFTMAVLLNHVVSSVDAFLSARSGSDGDARSGRDVNLEFDVADGGDGITCAVVARY
jgi:hypothetical protein